jgi:cysteine desulfurase
MNVNPTSVPGNLDAAGGQLPWPAAVDAWGVAQQRAWADPGRLHQAGRQSLHLLFAARSAIAAALLVPESAVHLSSSGVGAIQAAIGGVLDVAGLGRGRLVISAVEPLAAFDMADRHDRAGGAVSIVPVDRVGRIDLDALAAELGPDVVGVVLQAANAEVGTRQPLAAAHALCQAAGVPLIVDAAQVIGHDGIPQDWDILIGHARDWASTVPLGVVAVRTPSMWRAPYGSQHGWLGGVADVPGAVAAATALDTCLPGRAAQAAEHFKQIELLRARIAAEVSDVDLVGDPTDRLPHVLTFSLLYVAGDAIVSELDRRGFAVASGSACVVDSDRASHVLAAMGALTGGNLRITLPYGSSTATIEAFCAALIEAVAVVREDV